jgi:DNA repair exonuclease SbcCD ATPase subunit
MPASESEHDRRITAREGSVSGAWRPNSSASTHEIDLILANLPIFPGLEPFEARADAPDSSIGGFSRGTAAEVATDPLPPPARRRHAEDRRGRRRHPAGASPVAFVVVYCKIQHTTTNNTANRKESDMASEAIITEELICKAAEQLAAEGMRPTNETVRELLAKWTSTKGGSYATIGPVLRAWKARRKAAESAEPVREAAPQVVLDKVQGWASDMWGVALELANGRLASERESLERVRQELEAETAEALALAEKREDERDEARRQAAELTDQLASLQADVAAQTERAAAGEARAAELEKRANEVHDDLKAERARRDEAEAARRTVEAELSTQRADVARLSQQAADLERELAQVRGELARVQEQGAAELAAARKEHAEGVAAQRAQHDAEVGRLKDAHQQALHDQKQRSVEVIGKLEASKQRMEAELDEARKEARDAAAQLGRVTGELDALRSQVASQEATIRGFTAKKADKT